jgi:ATP-dependent DNA helicase RecG
MFASLLMEGKEPPIIHEIGDSVSVTLLKGELAGAFRLFVAEENERGHNLGVDTLLILQYLLKHAEVETSTAATICQRQEVHMRQALATMESNGYIEHGGSGRGTYWSLRPELHRRLAGSEHGERSRRIDWEAAKTRVLSILMERAKRGEDGLKNAELRSITKFTRNQVISLLKELSSETGKIGRSGHGAGSRYEWRAGDESK